MGLRILRLRSTVYDVLHCIRPSPLSLYRLPTPLTPILLLLSPYPLYRPPILPALVTLSPSPVNWHPASSTVPDAPSYQKAERRRRRRRLIWTWDKDLLTPIPDLNFDREKRCHALLHVRGLVRECQPPDKEEGACTLAAGETHTHSGPPTRALV